MAKTEAFTDTGCYLDSHAGHYIVPAVILFAQTHGYILGAFEEYVVNIYDDHNADDDYPSEGLHDLMSEAIEWLNWVDTSHAGGFSPMGQNKPPKRPDGTWWGFNDGDFGLYEAEDE